MKCPVCLSQRLEVHVDSPLDREYFVARQCHSSYFRCLECESLSLEPRPTAEETGTFYTAGYQNYSKTSAPLIGTLFAQLQQLSLKGFKSRFPVSSRVLDYGCNQGQFLKLLQQNGYQDLYGYDVVPLEAGANTGFAFYHDLQALLATGQKFDVIRMNHVIEHLPDVDSNMRLLAALLSDRGIIIGQTPNADHFTTRFFKSYWGGLHFPYHLTLFSPQSLAAAAARWGLWARPTRPTIVPTGWCMSFENIFKLRLFKKVSGRSPIYILFVLASAPFVLFDRLRGKTAIIDYEFEKVMP